MEKKLLEALRTIRKFYTGIHIHDPAFMPALTEYVVTHIDDGIKLKFDKKGKPLPVTPLENIAFVKFKKKYLKEYLSAINHPDEILAKFETYRPLILLTKSACVDALRLLLLTGKDRIELPETVERKDLINACEDLESPKSVTYYEERFVKLFDHAIRLLELQLPSANSDGTATMTGNAPRVIDFDKIPSPISSVYPYHAHFIGELKTIFSKIGHAPFLSSVPECGRFSEENRKDWLNAMWAAGHLKFEGGKTRGKKFSVPRPTAS